MRYLICLLFLSVAGCHDAPPTDPAQDPTSPEAGQPTTPEKGDPAVPEAGSDPTLAGAPSPWPACDEEKLAVIAKKLPEGFSGVGVLEEAKGKLPRRAPAWAKTAAEIIEDGGVRYLQASGASSRIRNPALARSNAEARARAKLAEWMAVETLVGSTITSTWTDPRTKTTLAQARVPVPPGWVPGQPLPAAQASDESDPPQEPTP